MSRPDHDEKPDPTLSDTELLHQLSSTASHLADNVAGPLHRVSVDLHGASVKLMWDVAAATAGTPAPSGASTPAPPPGAGTDAADPAVEENQPTVIRSPMVGTFYQAPAPGEPPFVAVGGTVEPETVVGIIEAMKLMNPITADHHGVVRHILVLDGHPVEFDQPIIELGSAELNGSGP